MAEKQCASFEWSDDELIIFLINHHMAKKIQFSCCKLKKRDNEREVKELDVC